LRFYKQNKTKLLQHKILLKLFTFKGIIGLNFLQTVRSRIKNMESEHDTDPCH
jgi:hypothetical protein